MIDPLAVVETLDVASTAKIWRWTHVREGARIGEHCIVGEHVYIDHDVVIGDGCKIQNGANLYAPLIIEDDVFIGPGVIVCNDRLPRAWGWDPSSSPLTRICRGSSIGAGAVLLPGVRIGENAVVGAGAVVTKSVLPNALVVGNPAKVV